MYFPHATWVSIQKKIEHISLHKKLYHSLTFPCLHTAFTVLPVDYDVGIDEGDDGAYVDAVDGPVAEGDAPEVCGKVGGVKAGLDLRLVGVVQVARQPFQVVHSLPIHSQSS